MKATILLIAGCAIFSTATSRVRWLILLATNGRRWVWVQTIFNNIFSPYFSRFNLIIKAPIFQRRHSSISVKMCHKHPTRQISQRSTKALSHHPLIPMKFISLCYIQTKKVLWSMTSGSWSITFQPCIMYWRTWNSWLMMEITKAHNLPHSKNIHLTPRRFRSLALLHHILGNRLRFNQIWKTTTDLHLRHRISFITKWCSLILQHFRSRPQFQLNSVLHQPLHQCHRQSLPFHRPLPQRHRPLLRHHFSTPKTLLTVQFPSQLLSHPFNPLNLLQPCQILLLQLLISHLPLRHKGHSAWNSN